MNLSDCKNINSLKVYDDDEEKCLDDGNSSSNSSVSTSSRTHISDKDGRNSGGKRGIIEVPEAKVVGAEKVVMSEHQVPVR